MEPYVILKDLFCKQCKLQFNKKIVYDIHLKIVHNKDTTIKSEPEGDKNDIPIEQPSECYYNENVSLCKKPVNDNSTVYEEKMQFKCIFCDASFTNHFSLKNHQEGFHEEKEVHNCLSTEEIVNSSDSIQNVNTVTIETFLGLSSEPLPRLLRDPLPRLQKEQLPRLPSQPLTILPTEPLPRLPTEPLPRLPTEPLPRLSSQPLTILPTEPLPRLLSEPLTRLPTKPLTMLPTEPLPRLPIEPLPIGIQNGKCVIIETSPRLPKEPLSIQTFQEISTEMDNFESASILEKFPGLTTESTLAQKSIMNMLPKSPVNQLHEEIHIKDEHHHKI